MDPGSVLRLLDSRPRRILELGCGNRKRYPEAVGIDLIDGPGVDVICDAADLLRSLPDNTVDYIYSSHFLEHVSDVAAIMAESERVLTPGGSFEAVVPHHSNPWFYSDPTHRSFFGLYTMSYFAEDRLLRRKVPDYARRRLLILESVDLVFKSAPPFYIRHSIRQLWQLLFNANTYTKELYEDVFSAWFPCYELRYRITKKATPPVD